MYFSVLVLICFMYFSLEELNISWAHLNDTDLHFLLTNMVPSVKRLNISGFLKLLADYGKL